MPVAERGHKYYYHLLVLKVSLIVQKLLKNTKNKLNSATGPMMREIWL
jgi:hypothetical protein